jgi:hypothetical protein
MIIDFYRHHVSIICCLTGLIEISMQMSLQLIGQTSGLFQNRASDTGFVRGVSETCELPHIFG